MKILNHIWIICIMSIILGCTESSPVKLLSEKTKLHEHLGYGYWFDPPVSFKRMTKPTLFQTSDGPYASISISETDMNIADIKSDFDPERLKRIKAKLLVEKEVQFLRDEEAYYSKIHHNRKRTIKFKFAFSDSGKNYLISAFCLAKYETRYANVIENAIFSLVKADRPSEKEEFDLAKLSSNEMIYTRGGNLPVESEKEGIITCQLIENQFAEKDAYKVYSLFQAKLTELGFPCKEAKSIRMTEGLLYSCERNIPPYGYSAVFVPKKSTNKNDSLTVVIGKTKMRDEVKFMRKFIDEELMGIETIIRWRR